MNIERILAVCDYAAGMAGAEAGKYMWDAAEAARAAKKAEAYEDAAALAQDATEAAGHAEELARMAQMALDAAREIAPDHVRASAAEANAEGAIACAKDARGDCARATASLVRFRAPKPTNEENQ